MTEPTINIAFSLPITEERREACKKRAFEIHKLVEREDGGITALACVAVGLSLWATGGLPASAARKVLESMVKGFFKEAN